MSEDNIPFGTPPVGFMQTGNQQVSLDPPIAATGGIFEAHSPESPSQKPSSEDRQFPQFEDVGGSPDFKPQTNQTTKYAIFDMFWLINQKFIKNPTSAK
jgi:hypothetical protein